MPPAKKVPVPKKKAQRKRGRAPGTMSTQHKAAMAVGRNESSIVKRYLDRVGAPKQRGRKVPREELVRRLNDANERVKRASGIDKLKASKEVRELTARLATGAQVRDEPQLEKDFMKVAKGYAERNNFTYGDFRTAGVPSDVLAKAGIKRART
jgi:hypothetical protein